MRRRYNEMPRLTVRFKEDVFKTIETAAKEYNKTRSEIIRMAVHEWLEKNGFLKG